jgi:glycosyltransferase involved in cell wall biosynthesis
MAIRVVSIISRMNVGGPAVLLSEFIKSLPADQFHHTLITGTCLGNEIDYLDSHPLDSEVIYIDEIKRSILPLNDIKSFFKLIRILRQIKPDIVHTHTSKAGVLGRLAAKIVVPRARVIHTYHGHLLYGYFPKWKTNLIVLLEKFLARFSDGLVAVTHQVMEDLKKAGIGELEIWHVIRPGLPVSSQVDKAEALKSLGIPTDKTNLVWIGRFTDIKNPMLAIKAIESLESDIRQDVTLVMAGSGELLKACQRYSTAHSLPIYFTGWITDINPVLGVADLLLMSSRNEGMPVVIVEAALRGIPTITTSVGGVKEFVNDGSTGWLTEQTPESISERISQLVNTTELREVGDRAKSLAETEFSIDTMVKNHINLYQELATVTE